MITEQTFFNEGGVTVTNARFIVPSQTYAMSGVTSVKSSRRNPSKIGSLVLLVLGVLAMLLNILLLGLLLIYLLGLLLIGAGVVWWRIGKPGFAVVLNSASGEAEALTSDDANFISLVVDALNEAILARG